MFYQNALLVWQYLEYSLCLKFSQDCIWDFFAVRAPNVTPQRIVNAKKVCLGSEAMPCFVSYFLYSNSIFYLLLPPRSYVFPPAAAPSRFRSHIIHHHSWPADGLQVSPI